MDDRIDRPRRIVIPGGSGHLGRILVRHFLDHGDQVTVLGRSATPSVPGATHVQWPARWPLKSEATGRPTWCTSLDGADVVINLAGRTVDCRYTKENLEQMFSSRIDSTEAIGAAIAQANTPPPLWLQMSTATIYAHTLNGTNDEPTGVMGGFEAGAEPYWRTSVRIARDWERAQSEANTPSTRRVALRTAMVMSREPGGAFAVLERLARFGLGGPVAGGRMSMSWIHELDFVRAIEHVIQTDSIHGPVNLAAPEPVPQRDFMATLRRALTGPRVPFGVPQPAWLVRLGAAVLRTDPELVLKSRRVVSSVLPSSGFQFSFPRWVDAVDQLA